MLEATLQHQSEVVYVARVCPLVRHAAARLRGPLVMAALDPRAIPFFSWGPSETASSSLESGSSTSLRMSSLIYENRWGQSSEQGGELLVREGSREPPYLTLPQETGEHAQDEVEPVHMKNL